jgi:hypothetical protein
VLVVQPFLEEQEHHPAIVSEEEALQKLETLLAFDRSSSNLRNTKRSNQPCHRRGTSYFCGGEVFPSSAPFSNSLGPTITKQQTDGSTTIIQPTTTIIMTPAAKNNNNLKGQETSSTTTVVAIAIQ